MNTFLRARRVEQQRRRSQRASAGESTRRGLSGRFATLDAMPKGDNKKSKLIPGRAVKGAPGIIYRETADKQKRFEAFVSYRDVRHHAQTWSSLEEAKEAQRRKLAELRAGTP